MLWGGRWEGGSCLGTHVRIKDFKIKKNNKKIKGIEKASDIDIRKGQKEYPLASISNGVIYLLISYYNESKECLKFVKILPDPLPQFAF